LDAGGTYTIKQADTLWDISNTFLRDPFLWPLIWKVNPYITNPDLIYPGNTLVIPSLAPIEQAIKPRRQKKPGKRPQRGACPSRSGAGDALHGKAAVSRTSRRGGRAQMSRV
jgi:hypothetical protein